MKCTLTSWYGAWQEKGKGLACSSCAHRVRLQSVCLLSIFAFLTAPRCHHLKVFGPMCRMCLDQGRLAIYQLGHVLMTSVRTREECASIETRSRTFGLTANNANDPNNVCCMCSRRHYLFLRTLICHLGTPDLVFSLSCRKQLWRQTVNNATLTSYVL